MDYEGFCPMMQAIVIGISALFCKMFAKHHESANSPLHESLQDAIYSCFCAQYPINPDLLTLDQARFKSFVRLNSTSQILTPNPQSLKEYLWLPTSRLCVMGEAGVRRVRTKPLDHCWPDSEKGSISKVIRGASEAS